MNTANASLPPRGALRYLSLCVLTTLYSRHYLADHYF